MKLILFVVILAFLFTFSQAEETLAKSLKTNVFKKIKKFVLKGKSPKKAPKKCKPKCDCPRDYKPVCGKSGRTHHNECHAKCNQDEIAKQGHCSKKCGVNPNLVSKKKCRFAPYKTHGNFRSFCCYYKLNKITKTKSKSKCFWKGPVHKTEMKVDCYWKKRGEGKQRYCCQFLRKWVGKKSTDGPRKCKFIGHKITVIKSKKCNWKTFGKYGKRKQCCNKLTTCLGKQCNSQVRNCAFKGPIYTQRLQEQCGMRRRGKHCSQQKCCEKKTRCVVYNKNKRKCGVRDGKCRWVGPKFCRKRTTRCYWKQYGTNSRRLRCCSFLKFGKVKADIKCKWSGCAVKTSVKSSCKFIKRDPKTMQTFCCKWTQTCKCKMCSNGPRKCKFVGEKIVKHISNKCYWVATGKSTRKRRCCKLVKRCEGEDKCKLQKTCSYVGDSIRSKQFTKCKWININKNHKKQSCCTYNQNCIGKKCKTSKVGCKFLGFVITKVQRNCFMKKHGTHSKRQYCCVHKKKCTKKGCKKLKPKCSFKGKVISLIPKHKCSKLPYGTKGTRQHCCKWTNYCEGKKCSPIRKQCQWKGPITKRFYKTKCSFVPVKVGKQKKCCSRLMHCVDQKCKEVSKKCKLVGYIFQTTNLKACYYKRVGKNSRKKWCCRKQRVCKGDECKVREGKCGWVGDLYTKISKSKCTWRKVNNLLKRQCCNWIRSCVNKKCVNGNKTCSYLGTGLKVSKSKTCKWRIFSKFYKRQYCCVGTTILTKKNPMRSKQCYWKGKVLKLTKRFWKKQRVCSKTQCCYRLYRCVNNGKKHKCTFKKNVGCTPRNSEYNFVCVNWGTAHTTPFSHRTFDHYQVGDAVLFQSTNFTCHIRLTEDNKIVGTRKIACNIQGDRVESTLIPRMYVVNGQQTVVLKAGEVFKLPNGGTIKQYNEKRFTIDSDGNGYVFAEMRKHYLSIITKVSNQEDFKGLCSGKISKKPATGIFSKVVAPKPSPVPKKCANFNKNVAKCREVLQLPHGRRFMIAACAIDLCLGIDIGRFKYIISEKKLVKKHPLKACRWVGIPNKANCVGYKCCLIKKGVATDKCKVEKETCVATAIGGYHFCRFSGDPHFSSFTGKYYDNYALGDYIVVKQPLFEIHNRQKRWGGASVTTAFVVRVNLAGDTIELDTISRQKINGKVISLAIGQTMNAPNGGSIRRNTHNNFRITGKDGSYVDANINVTPHGPQSQYMDLVIFTNSNGAAQGLCVASNQVIPATGLFNHQEKPVTIEKAPIPEDKKVIARKQCEAAGITKENLDACATDVFLSEGKITPESFLKILIQKKHDVDRFEHIKEKTKKDIVSDVVKRLQQRVTCSLYADPHAQNFRGVRFEAQTLGDWILYGGREIQASYRGKKFGVWVGITEYIVNVRGDIIRNVGFTGISINGKPVQPANGKTTLPKGGFIIKAGNKITISSNDGEEIDFVSGGYYFNAYVRSNVANTRGICNKEFIKSKAFAHPQNGKIEHGDLDSCKKRWEHQASCEKLGLEGQKLWDCVFDLCSNFPIKKEKDLWKEIKEEKHIHLKDKFLNTKDIMKVNKNRLAKIFKAKQKVSKLLKMEASLKKIQKFKAAQKKLKKLVGKHKKSIKVKKITKVITKGGKKIIKKITIVTKPKKRNGKKKHGNKK